MKVDLRSVWEVGLRNSVPNWGGGGEERGGAQEGTRASGLGDWVGGTIHRGGDTEGGIDLEGRSRRWLVTWLSSSGERTLDSRILERQHTGGN